MKNSSAARLEAQYRVRTTDTRTPESSDPTGEMVTETALIQQVGDSGSAISLLKPPNFDDLASIYAITSRRAGRLNATKITSQEHTALLRERQTLLDKKFAEEITRQETNRLEYIRWSLDRIEDARHGDALDALEAAVGRYEHIEDRLLDLKEQLLQAVDSERQRQKRDARRR